MVADAAGSLRPPVASRHKANGCGCCGDQDMQVLVCTGSIAVKCGVYLSEVAFYWLNKVSCPLFFMGFLMLVT